MFKDTIHVDDYGSIKETLFKFPSMTRVSNFLFLQLVDFRVLKIKFLAFTSLVTTLTRRSASVTMWTRTNGRSKSWVTVVLANFTSAQLQLPFQQMRSSLLEVAARPRKTLVSIWPLRMKSQTRVRWMKAGMLTLLQCAEAMCLCWVDSVASNVLIVWKGTKLKTTNGHKWQWWRTNVTTWVLARSTTSSFTRLAASSEAQSKKSTIRLRSMTLTRTHGSS